MIWNDPSIMIKRKKNHEVKMAQYIGLVVDVIVVGFVRFCYFFFFPLVYRQHHYLTYVFKRLVNRESSGIFNIYDVIVWFLDNILLYIW